MRRKNEGKVGIQRRRCVYECVFVPVFMCAGLPVLLLLSIVRIYGNQSLLEGLWLGGEVVTLLSIVSSAHTCSLGMKQ